MRQFLHALIAIADEAGDSEDARVRKRVGVISGYLTIVAPLSAPLQARGNPIALALSVGLSLGSAANLVILARTHRFERYVTALLLGGLIFVPSVTMIGGGITGTTSGLSWGFLGPGYAIMALGPRAATPWFVAFLGMVAFIAVLDPWVHAAVGSGPYALQLSDQVVNAVLPFTIIFLLLRYLDLRRIEAEARADELLANAIPRSIVDRLRRGEQRIAERYPATTILFADIVESTPWERQTDPATVVATLDRLFTRFDALAAECGVEKIKTVGDAYMAAAGAPVAREDHARAAVRLALAIVDAVAQERLAGGIGLRVRVGLASGPAVGGVIGAQRAAFDLWGDTVNLAARMESTGIPDRIQVAAETRALLGEQYAFEAREVEVKGIGPMATYLVAAGVEPTSTSR